MAKIVSTLFSSLDGVVEIDPAWHFPYFDEAMGAGVGEDYENVDVLLIGRGTYEDFAGAWPGREAAGGEDAAFAAELGDTRKVVVTRGDQDLGWRNAEAIQGDLIEAVRALSAEEGVDKILIPGSISVVRQLLAAGLLDELRLFVHPVAARHGERLFDEGQPIYPFRLLHSEAYPAGVVRLVYETSELPGEQTYDDVTDKVPGADKG
ncbi:dihydrofolate reductase family protein [Cellulomonas cellasea]|uniref:dihydrofolate reductase family protein n=1 Tax=Cellulomonas cellasea TaxID=43670 RepID=UPI0025A393D5|nr:dihydrofolate reductase family protein [Cellulomonas cellasea]MDM8086449.1 dihydrofolate reductase family protein [Cellulomonas cellasea]